MSASSPTERDPALGGPAAAEQSVDLAVGRLVREVLTRKSGGVYYHVQEVVGRTVLCEVLQHVKGNQVEAADLLDISRTTLRAKLRRLGLAVEKVKPVDWHWETPAVTAADQTVVVRHSEMSPGPATP